MIFLPTWASRAEIGSSRIKISNKKKANLSTSLISEKSWDKREREEFVLQDKNRYLTQKEVNQYLNISQVAYSYYEINKRSIPLEILSKLADFYNTSTDYLLYRTEEIMPYPRNTIHTYNKKKINLEQKSHF